MVRWAVVVQWDLVDMTTRVEQVQGAPFVLQLSDIVQLLRGIPKLELDNVLESRMQEWPGPWI